MRRWISECLKSSTTTALAESCTLKTYPAGPDEPCLSPSAVPHTTEGAGLAVPLSVTAVSPQHNLPVIHGPHQHTLLHGAWSPQYLDPRGGMHSGYPGAEAEGGTISWLLPPLSLPAGVLLWLEPLLR